MLRSLHVKNMALIREAEVEFGPGLNAMTGETGAGKSIVIGSVNIALGTGNFKDYVPADADYALVELTFTTENPRVLALLEERDLPLEDGEIILTRRYKGGRSVSKVNGETVPLSVGRALAGELIDIHGQHEHQSLLYAKNHLAILDSFAKEEGQEVLAECAKAHARYRKAKQAYEKAQASVSERAKELDFLQYEIHEIQSASLRIGEDEELEGDYRRMANAQKIMEALQETANQTGAGGYGGAAEEIGRAARALMSVRGYDETLHQLGAALEDIESLLSDFNYSLSAYTDELTYDPQELQAMEERLDLLNRLKTKYGGSIEEILASLQEKEARLEVLFHYEEHLGSLQQELDESRAELFETAGRLSKIRRRNAKLLGEQIRQALVDLNFLEVRFEIDFQELEEPNQEGMDEISFLISMNPGLPLRPLGAVASGGELSRIMLAIKAVMADRDRIETLIFDEIDTGISGRTAQKVSEKMAVIARNHQILCITHLAQIAAMADGHYIIEKKPADSKTVTNIARLREEESVSELARILGGARITEAVLENAREMKALARGMKGA